MLADADGYNDNANEDNRYNNAISVIWFYVENQKEKQYKVMRLCLRRRSLSLRLRYLTGQHLYVSDNAYMTITKAKVEKPKKTTK